MSAEAAPAQRSPFSFLNASIPVGSVLRIPVRIHVLFFIVLGMQVVGAWIARGSSHALLWFWLLGPVLAVTVLLHELGHALAARWVGGEAHSILLWPLGGLAFIGHNKGPKADIWVAVAGPLTHVPQMLLWLLLLVLTVHGLTGRWDASLLLPRPTSAALMWQAVCAGALIINLSLMLFNLCVPAYPLDGGRILADTLLACGVRELLAAQITLGVAVPIGIAIVVFGCVVFQVITILAGAFILHSCWQLYAHVRTGSVDQHPLFAGLDKSECQGQQGSLASAAQPPAGQPGWGRV